MLHRSIHVLIRVGWRMFAFERHIGDIPVYVDADGFEYGICTSGGGRVHDIAAALLTSVWNMSA
jgi:hypothetical protein